MKTVGVLPLIVIVLALGWPGMAEAQVVSGFGDGLAIQEQDVFIGETGNALLAGTVYRYALDAGQWVEKERLSASDATTDDEFGAVLDAEGGLLAVGAPGVGAVYIFRKTGATWTQEARLVGSAATPGDQFGHTLSLSGDDLAVGAYGGERVYLFQRDAATGTWAEQTVLTGSLGDGDFGRTLALEGDHLLIGAPLAEAQQGVLYAFRRNAATGVWVEQTTLRSNSAAEQGYFGWSLALDDGTAVAGTLFENQVYVYRLEGDVWKVETVLADENVGFTRLGRAVALDGGTAWVSDPSLNSMGAVAVFRRDSGMGGWQPPEVLVGSEVTANDQFGSHVAVEGSLALATAAGDDFGAGTVYVYTREPDGAWTEAAVLAGSRGTQEPILGRRVPCAGGQAEGYACSGIDLLAFLPVEAMGGKRGVGVNDLWGWTDPETGSEYAIIGRLDGTSFVDISDPTNPIYLGNLPTTEGTSGITWRDIKVYANHAFVVSEDVGHGLQIFDLTQLRAVNNPPVTFTETAHYDGFGSAHNIAINEETGFAYALGTRDANPETPPNCTRGLHMIDISDPTQPAFAGCFQDVTTGRASDGYTHDAHCVVYHGPDAAYADREICFGANETAISIADVTNKANPVAVSKATYPNVGYVHQGWLTEDHRYFIQNDELDERNGLVGTTRTLIWDVTDLDDPLLLTEYFATTPATDHNLYVKRNYVFEANYASGLRILDISNIELPREIAFFDTFPSSDDAGFDGVWSVYPFFPSGVLIVSGRAQGLFILDATDIVVASEREQVPARFALSAAYPNPFNPATQFTLTVDQAQPVAVRAYDVQGRVVAVLHEGPLPAGTHHLVFEARNLPSGTYLVRAEGRTARQTQVVTLAK